jgi:hypothetical protein
MAAAVGLGARLEPVGRLRLAAREAFVPPLSADEVWAGNGARGRGMRYLVAYWPDLFVFVGAPTLAWFVFFG